MGCSPGDNECKDDENFSPGRDQTGFLAGQTKLFWPIGSRAVEGLHREGKSLLPMRGLSWLN